MRHPVRRRASSGRTAVRARALGLVLLAAALTVIALPASAKADPTPPTVTLTSPTSGTADLRSVVTLTADATAGSNPIDHVEFYYDDPDSNDGNPYDLGGDSTAPYSFTFDTTSVPNCESDACSIYAVGVDTLSVQGESSHVAVGVHNPIVVDSTASDGSGSCSLRNAIAAAYDNVSEYGCKNGLSGSPDTIELPAATYQLDSANPELVIASDLSIVGAGAHSTEITGGGLQRVLEVSSGSVRIDGVTIDGGHTSSGGGENNAGVGGGIYVDSGASLALQDTIVRGNSANVAGGGIENDGTLTIFGSTIENNSVGGTGVGGGLADGLTDLGSSLTIMNSTIMDNTAQTGGGGLYLAGAATLTNDTIYSNSTANNPGGGIAVDSGIDPHTIYLTSTIVADNKSFENTSNCSDSLASLGGNIADDGTCGLTDATDQPNTDPQVGLVDSSGPTDGVPLLTGSPAIGAGILMSCLLTDQRDALRNLSSSPGCDSGAFEYTSGPPSNYDVFTVGELNAALSALMQAEINGTVRLDDGHYDIGNLIGFADVGGGTTIDGQGAAGVILDGNASTNEVFDIEGGDTSTIKGVTVENSSGDGIYDDGTLTLDNSVLWDNQGTGVESVNQGLNVSGSTVYGNGDPQGGAQFNGGIYSEAPLTVVNSTVTGNDGSGVYGDFGGMDLQNVTIADNSGVGLQLHTSPTTAVNTIIAGNTPSDCAGTFDDWQNPVNNLDSDSSCGFVQPGDVHADPKLGPLQDNGGPTPTMALLPGSPAIDAGDDSTCATTDQRATTRPQGAHCDIGAFELVPGSIAFVSNRTGHSQIWTMAPDGSNPVQLTHDPPSATDTLPSISPDGHTVVYQSDVSGTKQIWAINGDGTDPRQLTSSGSNVQPTFSPDGKKIAFDSDRNGYFELYVMNADGSGQTKVMDTDGAVGGSSWSPDGLAIVFNEDTNGTNEIYTVDVASGTVTGPLTTAAADGANTNPHWSPDGSHILFVSNRCDALGMAEPPVCGGGESVFLMDTNGTNQENLTQAPIFDADPTWSPDGSKIAFTRDLGGQNFNVFTANADGTNQVQLTNGGAPSRNSFPNWGTQLNAPAETFTVNTSSDSNDGSCMPALCSLRDAIDAANAAGGGIITFNIPGGWPQTINIQSSLPDVTAPVNIDGTSQPGTPPGKPGVTISGNGVVNPSGIDLAPGSGGSTVRGLALQGYETGGEGAPAYGLDVRSDNNTVVGNYVGLYADASSGYGSDYGIIVTGNNNTIGGPAGDANVVVSGVQQAIAIQPTTGGPSPVGNVVQGNLIGLQPDGTPSGGAGNGILVSGATGTVIGDNLGPSDLSLLDPSLGNVIAGTGDAIRLGAGSTGTIVAGNFVGVDRSGTQTSPNADGVVVYGGSSKNQIGPGNTIAHTARDGVEIVDGTGNRIVANSIFDSGTGGLSGAGIDLQNGGNDSIGAPVVTSTAGGTVSGTVSSPNDDPVFIEVFVSPSCSAPYANGAGQTYAGSETTAPGTFGVVPFTGLTPGEGVTVTSTVDSTDQYQDDTSEFSNCSTVGADGTLSGSVSTSGQQNANLTALGSQDWAIWGYGNAGTSTSLVPDVRKAGGSGISNLTDVHQNGAPLRGLGQFASDLPFTFDWSDGTVPSSATGAAAGLQHDGQVGTVGANGDGFSFTVPADTTQRTLTVYTTAHWATGTLTATLSDGSAQPYTQDVTGQSSPDEGNVPGVFTIDYAAASAGQHLTVTWVETAGTCPSFGCDNAAIYAVALGGPGSGTVSSASASLGSDASVEMSGSVPTSHIPLAAFEPQPPGAPPITINGLQLANTQLANTQLANTQLANTQLANTQLAHTQLANTQLANTQLANTQLANTQLANTQLANTQLANTQLANTPLVTQLANTQLAHTQLAHTGLPLDTVPLNTTLFPDGWAALLKGTKLEGDPLQTVTLHDVLSLQANATDVPNPPGGKTAQQVIDQLQSLNFADIALPSSTLGQVTVGALALGGAEINQLGGDLQSDIESQLHDWCESVIATGDPNGFCSGTDPVMGDLSLIQLGLLGAPVASLQLANTQLANTQLANTPLSTSASGIAGMQLANTDLTPLYGIGGLFVNDLPPDTQSALFDCTHGFNCATGTLAGALAAGAINPSATLGDLDEGGFLDKVTIADLLATVLGPGSAYRASVNFGDLVGLFLRSADVPWESLTPSVLAIFDPQRPSMSMTAGFGVQGTGTPAADVKIDLPAGFDYKPGSASLTKNGNAAPAPGDPTITNMPGGVKLDWHFDSLVPDASYALDFSVYGNTTVGPTQATEVVSAGGQSDSSVRPFSVTDSFPNDGTPGNAAPVDTAAGHDTVEVSTLPRAGAVDYYTFPMPAAGTRIQVHLTNLPADYDLALYSPRTTSVRTTTNLSPPLQDGIVPDTQVNLNTGTTSQLTPTGLEDVPDPGIPLVQLSDNRHQDDEDVGMVSPGGSGNVTIAVFGYNGAFSPDAYTLRVKETAPPTTAMCDARSILGGGTTIDSPFPSNLSSLPANLNTIILVDEKRLGATYGSGPETTAVGKLHDLANDASLGVSGVVVPVETLPNVQTLYNTWDTNPCDPNAANAVANAIADEVDAIVAARPSVKYVVFGGGDDQIPFFRLPDLSLVANESGFAGQFSPNEYRASLAAGDLLSDDPYLDTQPVPASGQQLFPPNLAGGRLVETAQDIASAVTNFETAPTRGALKSSTGFVSGYDFVADGSQSVADGLTANGVSVRTLDNPLSPTSSWGATAFTNAAFPAGGPADINSWNGHYDNYRAQMANGDVISTSDLPSGLHGGILFTMGCHAGFQTTDAVVGSAVLDWPQYAAQHDTGFVGNTGFGLGDTDSVAFSEQLMAYFAAQLKGTSTLGNALLQAKQQYYLSRTAFSNYDEKALSEAELYGLPMYGIGHSPSSLAPLSAPPPDPVNGASASTSPSQGSLSSFPGSGVQSAGFAATPNFSPKQTGANGNFFTNAGQVQAPNYRPLQPYVSLPAARSGLVAHGVVIDTLTSEDHTPFTPDNVRPILNSSAAEPPPTFTDEAWPEKIPTLVSLGSNQNLNLITGQFFTETGSSSTGVERLWKQINGRVTYSNSQDFTPPTIDSINAFQSNGVVAFSGQFSDLDQNGNPGTVKFAQVVYDDGLGHWTALPLQLDSQSGLWSGAAPFAGGNIQYFVEACDAAGNCGYSSNKGRYFDAQPLPTGTGGGSLTITPSRAPDAAPTWYTHGLSASATSNATTVSVSVDGGPFQAGPVSISGDGAHVVDARDSDGNTATAVYLVDSTGPAITHTVSPAAPDGTNGWYKTKPAVTFTCFDNVSGVASCSGSTTLGDSSVSQTVNASASDNAGNTSTDSVTVTKVDSTAPATPAFHGITNGATYKPSALPAQSAISCTSSDGLSGLAGCVVTGYSAALGTHTLTATATDNAGNTATSTLTYTVAKLDPTITWNPPASMLFGTKLSSTQLNASANVAGTFVYSPASGTLLQPGSRTLSVTFTPTNTTDYNTATASRTITVGFSQSCLTGSLSGSLTVKSGNAYCIQGGKVSGSITVQSGGSLYISGGAISGSITSNGATAMTMCGTSVSGSITISSSSGLVELGGSAGSGCTGNKLSSAITLTGNTAGVIAVGDTVSGAVTASSNKGGVFFSGNKVSGSITMNGNSGGVTFTNNVVSGSVTITNNTGGFTFSGNTISGTVTLKNNT